MRKIPTGAEASNVLVGEVDFLDYQFSAFVRLSRSVVLGDFTEVPVPTRFLFIILGPKGNIAKYHEIGRSISTLMSDEVYFPSLCLHYSFPSYNLFLLFLSSSMTSLTRPRTSKSFWTVSLC